MYIPKRILILQDQDSGYLGDLLAAIEVPIDKVQMDKPSFVMPELYVKGEPQYSHVVIYGERSYLTKEDLEKLARFADGSDDPMYSRLSHHERETLPNLTTYVNNATTRVFSKFFDPYPGGSIMLISSNTSFRLLLNKIGAQVVENDPSGEYQVEVNPILANLKEYQIQLKELDAGLYVKPAYKNKRAPFTTLGHKGENSLIAAWRGVKNSARIVFLGNSSFVSYMNTDNSKYKSTSIKLFYDLVQWFGMNTQLIKVQGFTHRVLNLTQESKCRQNLHLSHATGDHVREGNLVLVELDIQEYGRSGWAPLKPLKEYKNFADMVEQVGFVSLQNKNFQSVMKKQTKSFLENYDLCMHELFKDYSYTELQVFESFVQDWYNVNLIQDKKTKKYYALLEPDLVRSYTLQVDIDRDITNRINLIERVHAYVDRFEDNRFFIGNSVWQIALFAVIGLSILAVLFLLIDKPENPELAQKKDE